MEPTTTAMLLLEVQDSDNLCEMFGGATVTLDGSTETQTGSGIGEVEVSIQVSNGAQLDQLTDETGQVWSSHPSRRAGAHHTSQRWRRPDGHQHGRSDHPAEAHLGQKRA